MKEWFIHLAAQLGVAAAGAVVTTASGIDYSHLGVWAPLAQAVTAVGVATYNNFFSARAKS